MIAAVSIKALVPMYATDEAGDVSAPMGMSAEPALKTTLAGAAA